MGKFIVYVGKEIYEPEIISLDSKSVAFQDISGYLSFEVGHISVTHKEMIIYARIK